MSLDAYAILAGSSSRLLLLVARTAGDGSPAVGLNASSPGASAAFVREGEPGARPLELVPGTPGHWDSGGFVEIDPEMLPGVYQVGAPDEMLAKGSARAVMVLRFPGAIIEPIEVDLVGYDPQDSVRLGMGAISPEARIAALRGAFPRLTERELQIEHALKEPD